AAVDGSQQDAIGAASAGYVGESDGWQDFHRNGALTWGYRTAGPGNVALVAALPRSAVLALGFGSGTQAAATLAIACLMQPFDNLLKRQIETWRQWHTRRNAPRLCSHWAPNMKPATRCATSSRPRTATGVGGRINGLAARLIGKGCNWTRPDSRCCSLPLSPSAMHSMALR